VPKALLWDFGNVIVRWDPRTLYSKIFPDAQERDRFLGEVATLEWHAATDAGVSFADNVAALTAKHPQHAVEIAAWHGRWSEMFSGPIPQTEAAIEALHARGVPQYGLSNISAETLDSTMAMSPAFQRLTGVICSGHEKIIKPDPAIYLLACARFGVAPEDFLFVDDSAKNIEAAARLGLDVHHFTDPAELRPALERRGLL
jgi:2-haloacid dehalogenase/putative hydrolase of the HAD superfamily